MQIFNFYDIYINSVIHKIPYGFIVINRYESWHISSNVNFVCQPNIYLALVGSAVRMGTSPALLSAIICGNFFPKTFEYALTISKTLWPIPDPKFIYSYHRSKIKNKYYMKKLTIILIFNDHLI